jgi:hypothetical protein
MMPRFFSLILRCLFPAYGFLVLSFVSFPSCSTVLLPPFNDAPFVGGRQSGATPYSTRARSMASGGMESAYLALSSLFSTSYTPTRGCLFNSFIIPLIVTEVPLGDMQFDYVTYCMFGVCAGSAKAAWREISARRVVAIHSIDVESMDAGGFSLMKVRVSGWSESAYRAAFPQKAESEMGAAAEGYNETVELLDNTVFRNVKTVIGDEAVEIQTRRGEKMYFGKTEILRILNENKQ